MDKKGIEKESHMDWMPIQITEITSYLSKAYNWKSPGNDQIKITGLKLSQLLTGILKKNFNVITEEPEKAPDWLTAGITYVIPKSGDSKEVRNYSLQKTAILGTSYIIRKVLQYEA